MVFQLKVRLLTKNDEKKLCIKYGRFLRKNNKDTMKIICDLFLELIYLYFNNKKRKLYKLFFPVIMANLIEQGSINSVIEEYKNKKRLYSESYTCRILKQLDDETGLEISRIFRRILFKILKRIGLKNKGYCIAIDITAKPFYGNKKYCRIIKLLKYKFIMPITKNRKLREIELSIENQSFIDDKSYNLSELNYIFYEKESKEY